MGEGGSKIVILRLEVKVFSKLIPTKKEAE